MSFESKIQQWVSLDNQLKQINEKVKDLRDKRNDLEENITSYASENNLSNATVKIGDGRLKFTNTKVQEPLTFKYLEKSLSEMVKNESQVKQMVDYIKRNRDIKTVSHVERLH